MVLRCFLLPLSIVTIAPLTRAQKAEQDAHEALAYAADALRTLQEIDRLLPGPPVDLRLVPSSSSGDLQTQAPPPTPRPVSPIMASMPTGRSRDVPEFQPTIAGFKAFFEDVEECL